MIEAICTQSTAVLPASPCESPNWFLRITGIQSLITQPAIAGSVK